MKKYLIWLNLLFFLGFGGTVPGLVLASQRTDIVTSAGSGGGPHILRFSADGSRTLSNFFAYDNEYRSWTSIASGDIDGDREPEIVVGPGINHAGQVKIFQLDGTLKLVDFYPFGEQHTQGINVAVGDVDGDFIDELIFGSATESQAWIKIYKYSDEKLVLTQFMAYASNFRGGVYVAAG
ncbi:MAG: outer membrane autotransporter barrel protein, partial [uncultured bacterium]